MYLPDLTVFPMTFWDHLVAVVICVFAPAIAFSSRKVNLADIRFTSEDKIRLYHNNALLLSIFGLVVITTWRMGGKTLFDIGLVSPQWDPWVPLLILCVILFYALDIFFQYGLKRWREKTFEKINPTFTITPTDKRELSHFMFLALAAGVGEEIIFRGFLIHYLVSWTGNTPEGLFAAALFSSALFAYLHGYQGYKAVIKIFFLALLFAGIFVMSRSLLPVVILHTIIDAASGWLSLHLIRQMQSSKEQNIHLDE